ncbi:MAG: GNAT family N-acetyltransferase [Bacteroidales bacterium]|jgi:hypothetical protein|nr:GNAT family N-acetyltransferase [Bacteroidales bacterium]
MSVKKIPRRIRRRVIKSELTPERFICSTRHGGNLVYDITYHNSPYTMQEIGRLREIAFREAGGGTGNPVDIDEFDTMLKPFHQLLVWSPKEKEIISSYRYLLGSDIRVNAKGGVFSPTAELFNFSDEFITDYLPYSIELGRSFVQPVYQASRQGAFALDNIWDGLGAVICLNPHVKYFYGKMTMYKSYNKLARDLILYFLKKHFSADKPLIEPVKPLSFFHDEELLSSVLTSDDFNEDFKILKREAEKLQCKIPSLINIYMGLSPSMHSFGTTDNPPFGDVEETAILIRIEDIYESKKNRHIHNYLLQKEQ